MHATSHDRSRRFRGSWAAVATTTVLAVVAVVTVLSVPDASGASSGATPAAAPPVAAVPTAATGPTTARAVTARTPTAHAVTAGAAVVGIATTPSGSGWLAYDNGAASPFGGTPSLEGAPGRLNRPVVGTTSTPDGGGYWLVASDGGVFSFGDASFHGSTGSLRLNRPVVGMATTPDGQGYWLVASDGGVFSFGDARFHGSTGSVRLNQPIVGMAPTPDGRGYWLVASDGGVFSFGDARFHGSTGSLRLAKPVVGMAATPDGAGYWLVGSDGGVFSFGDARFHGSAAALGAVVVGMAPSPGGYTLASTRGPLIFTGSGLSPSAAPANPGGGFHGVYEYAGANSAADAADPDIAGVVLDYYWSQIEPTKGDYDWSVLTDAMAPWVAHGKKVILRVATAGQPGWDPPYSGSGTPSWVYADGARAVNDNGETVPVYWDGAYLADLSTFIAAYAAEFDGNPSVAMVEAGVGMGGETMPQTNLSANGLATWDSVGYSASTWLATVEAISTAYRRDFTRTPVYALLTSSFLGPGGNWPDYQALASWYAGAVPAWGLQNDALSAHSTLPDPTAWAGAGGLALEQAQKTSVSGDTLAADAYNGLAEHAAYLLIYRNDIENPAYAGTLAELASLATPG